MSSKRVQLPEIVVRDLKTALALKAEEPLPAKIQKNAESFWYVCSLLGFHAPTLDARFIALLTTFDLPLLEAEPEVAEAAKPEPKPEPKAAAPPSEVTEVHAIPYVPENWREKVNQEAILVIETGRGKAEKRVGTILDVIAGKTGDMLVVKSAGEEKRIPASSVKLL